MDTQHTNLASEILMEVKASAKRWFIAFIIMVALEILTIAGFLWYISSPVSFNDVQIRNGEGTANYIGRDLTGGIFNGEDNSN